MSSAAGVLDWVLVSNSASDIGINAAPGVDPGPGTLSREYCRGPVQCSQTFCVTPSCCLLYLSPILTASLGADVRGSGAG